jgi:hypothetical protein
MQNAKVLAHKRQLTAAPNNQSFARSGVKTTII